MVLNLRKLQNYKITYDQVAYDAGEAEAARLPLHVERLRNRLLSFRCIVPVEVKKSPTAAPPELVDTLPDESHPLYFVHSSRANVESLGLLGEGKERHKVNFDDAVQLATKAQRLCRFINVNESDYQFLFRKAIQSKWENFVDYGGEFPSKDKCDWVACGAETYGFKAAHKARVRTRQRSFSASELPGEPRPDLWFAFPIQEDETDDDSLSFDKLLELEKKCGLVSSPFLLLNEARWVNGIPVLLDKKLVCYPWALVELKKRNGNTKGCYCQAANACSVSLSMLEFLTRHTEGHSEDHVKPLVSFTVVGHCVKLWIAYTTVLDCGGNDSWCGGWSSEHHMKCIWQGDICVLKDTIEFFRILDTLLNWALRDFRPWIKTQIEACQTRIKGGGEGQTRAQVFKGSYNTSSATLHSLQRTHSMPARFPLFERQDQKNPSADPRRGLVPRPRDAESNSTDKLETSSKHLVDHKYRENESTRERVPEPPDSAVSNVPTPNRRAFMPNLSAAKSRSNPHLANLSSVKEATTKSSSLPPPPGNPAGVESTNSDSLFAKSPRTSLISTEPGDQAAEEPSASASPATPRASPNPAVPAESESSTAAGKTETKKSPHSQAFDPYRWNRVKWNLAESDNGGTQNTTDRSKKNYDFEDAFAEKLNLNAGSNAQASPEAKQRFHEKGRQDNFQPSAGPATELGAKSDPRFNFIFTSGSDSNFTYSTRPKSRISSFFGGRLGVEQQGFVFRPLNSHEYDTADRSSFGRLQHKPDLKLGSRLPRASSGNSDDNKNGKSNVSSLFDSLHNKSPTMSTPPRHCSPPALEQAKTLSEASAHGNVSLESDTGGTTATSGQEETKTLQDTESTDDDSDLTYMNTTTEDETDDVGEADVGDDTETEIEGNDSRSEHTETGCENSSSEYVPSAVEEDSNYISPRTRARRKSRRSPRTEFMSRKVRAVSYTSEDEASDYFSHHT